MIDMIASLFKLQILHMIEALLDIMKWPSWILHLSDCESSGTIAAIIVQGPRPIFSLYQLQRVIIAQNLAVNLQLWFLAVTGVSVSLHREQFAAR